MKNILKGSGTGYYSRLIAVVSGILALVVYTVYNLAIGKFTVDVFAAIVLGIAFGYLTLVNDFKFGPVLAVLATSLAIGFYLNDRIIMFEEMINHITGMTERGNIVAVVIVIFVLLFVSAISGVVASFTNRVSD